MSNKNWAIDLGTTNSSIAWSDNDKSQVVELSNGGISLPSMIVWNKDAGASVVTERKRSVFNYARGEEGEIFEEWKITGMLDTECNRPMLSSKGKRIDGMTPVYLSSMIISELIKQAEQKTGEKIEKLSVSVPANFNEEQRKNTLNAVKMAASRIKNVKLIHEPTAAAASLLTEHKIENILNKNILVYDMGGGTTDISVVKFSDDAGSVSIDVQGTNGINFAGKEIDKAIFKEFISHSIANAANTTSKAVRDFYNKDENKFDFNSVLFEAEKMKLELSKEKDDVEANFKVVFKNEEFKVNVEISYAKFVKVLEGRLSEVNLKIDEVLRKSKLQKNDIFMVVPAGSSSRGQWVIESINKYFGKQIVKEIVKPETAIAVGGSILSGINHNDGLFEYKENDLEINELVPNFVGVAVSGERASWMINKDSPIPISNKKSYRITKGGSEIIVEILESSTNKIPSSQAKILKMIQINEFISNTSENIPVELEMIYNDKMALTILLHYNGRVVEINDAKLSEEQERKIRQRDLSISDLKHEFLETLEKNGNLESMFREAISIMDKVGEDITWYRENNPTKEDKQELCFAVYLTAATMSN